MHNNMILILTQCFPSRVGGIESLISNLALGLSKKNKVIVFADQHHPLNDSIFDNKYKKEIYVRRFSGIKFLRRKKKIKDLKIFIKNNDVKLVLADTWKSLELCVEFLSDKNIKSICLAHGNELIHENIKKLKRIKSTLEKCSSVIGCSKYTLSLVSKILPTYNNLNYVYPGAEDLRNIKSQNFFKKDYGPILFTLARLEKRKGHDKVINTIVKLKTSFPDIKYIILGEGVEKNNLQKLVKKLSLEKNVFFTGQVDNSKKKYLFENADLLVMPTLDETHNKSIEGFGIAYIEAAFYGIPSIASNVGGSPEAVIHEKTGMVINKPDELYKTIFNLLSDKNKKLFLGNEAKKRAENEFNWEFVTNKYLKAFNLERKK